MPVLKIIFELNTLLCAVIGLLYGSVIVYPRHRSRYVHIVLLAMRSLILTQLFYIVLNLSGENADEYSVGVFGEISTCLFLLTANRAYNPAGERERPHVSALLAAAPAAVLYLFSAAGCADVPGTLCECAFLLTFPPAIYYAAKGIACGRCTGFNIAVLAYLYSWAGYESCLVWLPGIAPPRIALYVIQLAAIVAMLPLLERGLRKWTA